MTLTLLRSGLTASIAVLALAGCGSYSNNSSRNNGDNAFALQLLHFADVDGGGTAAMFNVDEFSALVDHFRSEKPDQTLLLSSGDNYIPGPIFEASTDARMAAVVGVPGQGRGEIQIQNKMGVQVSALGNHDLDTGPAGFASIISPDGEYPGALFPYLSVNIDFNTDDNTRDLVQADRQEASDLPPRRLGAEHHHYGQRRKDWCYWCRHAHLAGHYHRWQPDVIAL